MSEKVKAKLIEIDKTELKAGSKYIFLIDPALADWIDPIGNAIGNLIGDNFTLIPIRKQDFSVYEITDK